MTGEEYDTAILDADDFELKIYEFIEDVDVSWLSIFIATVNVAAVALSNAGYDKGKTDGMIKEAADFMRSEHANKHSH